MEHTEYDHHLVEEPRERSGLQVLVLAVLALLLIVSALEGYYLLTYVTEQRRTTDLLTCQSAVNAQFRDAIAARTAAAAGERDAQRQFLLTVGAPGATPEVRLDAYRTYLASLDAADKNRANTPLPEGNC